ncbi:hypothetical protein JOE31_003926 [Arthrobacter sp. PvP023]|nr:hypothetical protein [Arthrobacter sp. PvP023]
MVSAHGVLPWGRFVAGFVPRVLAVTLARDKTRDPCHSSRETAAARLVRFRPRAVVAVILTEGCAGGGLLRCVGCGGHRLVPASW